MWFFATFVLQTLLTRALEYTAGGCTFEVTDDASKELRSAGTRPCVAVDYVPVLQNKGIKSIAANAFAGVSGIKYLMMDMNAIGAFPSAVFDPLAGTLSHLELARNQLATIPAGFFDNLVLLDYLDLQENQLTSLQPDVFDALPLLTDLKISNNQLSTLEPQWFKNKPSLRRFEASHNQFTELPYGMFSGKGLDALENIHLNNNQLTSVPELAFGGLPSLLRVYLAYNQITTIAGNAFRGSDSIISIQLYSNQISRVPPKLVEGLDNLESSFYGMLKSNNPLTCAPLKPNGEEMEENVTTCSPEPACWNLDQKTCKRAAPCKYVRKGPKTCATTEGEEGPSDLAEFCGYFNKQGSCKKMSNSLCVYQKEQSPKCIPVADFDCTIYTKQRKCRRYQRCTNEFKCAWDGSSCSREACQ